MKSAIDLARKISKQLDTNWTSQFEEINLHRTFQPIFSLPNNIISINTICAFIIFSYDNDSNWLNIKQDRRENKVRIMKSLTEDYELELFQSIIDNEDEKVNDVIAEYLTIQTTWKWKHIMSQLDFYNKTMRFVNQQTEDEKITQKMNKEGEVKDLKQEIDVETLAKVAKLKGELLKQAQEARTDADNLLNEIRKEFVQLDNAVQQDFGFMTTEEQKIDPLSWRDFIKVTLPKLKEKQKSTAN